MVYKGSTRCCHSRFRNGVIEMDSHQFLTLLADNQSAHSDLQIDRFIILANGITEYGCYKQTLRELHTRFHAMLGYWLELETLKCDEADIGDPEGDRRKQLSLAKVRLHRISLEESFAESRREFLRFLGHAQYLKSKVGELTPERRAEFEREFWLENIRHMGPEKGQRLLQVMSEADRTLFHETEGRPYPQLPEPHIEFDVESMLTLTVETKLFPVQEQN